MEPTTPVIIPPNKTILAVADNTFLLISRVRLLTSLGYRVMEATHADKGLRVFRTHAINLRFTDTVRLARKDGIGLLDEALTHWPAPKTILASSFTDKRIRGDGCNLQVTVCFAHKPFRRDASTHMIQETLDCWPFAAQDYPTRATHRPRLLATRTVGNENTGKTQDTEKTADRR